MRTLINMAEGYCRGLIKIAMAQICQELGWNAIHSTPCDLMTDILKRYIQQLATISHQYAEHCKYMYGSFMGHTLAVMYQEGL